MIYTLATPINVGDFNHPILVDKLEVVSISLNFDPFYVANGTAILSVVLIHRASGWKMNLVYQDATGLAYWNNLNTANVVLAGIFNKLMVDQKLPPGTLA